MNKQISRWFLLIILSSSVFLSVIDIFIVNVAIPSIKIGIRGTDSDIQLIIVLYLLGYASFLITGGRAGDYYGEKRVFIISMLMFITSSCFCGFSQTSWEMNTARFFQGVSAAFMIPPALTYIQNLFPDQRARVKALGIYGSIAGAASVIGQFLGGVLPDVHFVVAGWRLIFLINLPVGLTAVFFAILYLRDRRPISTGQIDRTGVVLLVAALLSFFTLYCAEDNCIGPPGAL